MLPALFLAFYLLTAHYAVISGDPWPAAATLLALLLAGLWRPLRARRVAAWLGLLAALALFGLLARGERLMELLYFPPVAMNVAMLLLFGRTLVKGRTPLVTRIALALGSQPSAEVRAYTRSVTWAWVGFFVVMALTSALLALLAPPALWSLFANFINYLLIGLFFLLEYAVRGCFVDSADRGGFLGFMRALKGVDVMHLARRRRPE